MKAMVLAAGLGTRLRPLTDVKPKALVEVAGRSMLDRTLERLRAFGIFEVIVNAYHFADQIVEYLHANKNFGMRIEVSREETLLDTGGGLKRAAWFFDDDAPFVLQNVDVLSTIDLERMRQSHERRAALATLAVQDRKTSRPLLFDEELRLCGRTTQVVRPAARMTPLAFSGVHVISPRIFKLMQQDGAFSIITAYLALAARDETIVGFRADEYFWRDLGRLEDLEQAGRDLAASILQGSKPPVEP
jgi:NDP-sugar pyrophosphorylase family protein